MRSVYVSVVLLAFGTPAMAESVAAGAGTAPQAAATAAQGKSAAGKKTPEFDIGQVMAVFDKIFPPQPEPVPARLTLAKTAVQGLFPDGTYVKMVGGLMQGTIDRVMDMSEADFGKKADKTKSAGSMTLRQKLAKDDPNFEERMRITERVMREELAKMAAVIEPRLREGLARSMARRLDEKQLTDLNAFLATDSGKAFGSQSLAMWVDPDVVRSMMRSVPDIIAAMPAAMQRVEAETAHLPKPKTSTKPPR